MPDRWGVIAPLRGFRALQFHHMPNDMLSWVLSLWGPAGILHEIANRSCFQYPVRGTGCREKQRIPRSCH